MPTGIMYVSLTHHLIFLDTRGQAALLHWPELAAYFQCLVLGGQPSTPLMSMLIWRADQQGKASAVVVLAAALRAAAEVASNERQPAAHEADQITQADAIMQHSERELIQRRSATQPGGGSVGGPQLAEALLEAANALLEAAAGPLGGPLRRHLLSAAADVNHFAGGQNTFC